MSLDLENAQNKQKKKKQHFFPIMRLICWKKKLEDHWSCSSPERLSHCKLMRFKLIENQPMKVYAWTLLTPRGMAKFDPGA